MAVVGDNFLQRWRSGRHVQGARPRLVVELQQGEYRRGNHDWPENDVQADIPGENRHRPWYGQWTALSGWTEIPSVLECDLTHDFDQNGLRVASIQVENIAYTETTGPLGHVYHLVQSGFLAPLRGFRTPERPFKPDLASNAWFQVLGSSARVRVWEGYGDPERNLDGSMPSDGGSNGSWTFNGLIDDIDLTSKPDRITITARVGKTLTDQRLFGWAKSRTIRDPVTFCDRLEADDVKVRGGGATASSTLHGSSPRFVTDGDRSTAWRSDNHGGGNVTEWIEVRLPRGRYEDFIIDPLYEGMTAYVGVYVRNRVHGSQGGSTPAPSPPLVDGVPVAQGWVDLGNGDVPGGNGGWPFLKVIEGLGSHESVHRLGVKIESGDNTILRIGFRNLANVADGKWRAGVTRLGGRQRRLSEEADKAKWVLVDDAADVVKVCLRWAGFEEWEVEQTGVRLKGKTVFNRANFLIDPIKKAMEQTGYVFFVNDPSNGESLGVPVFRSNQAILTFDNTPEVRDSDLLTGIKVKITEEPLAHIIRVRGKEKKKDEGGVTLGADQVRRLMAIYMPPWSREGRLAGIVKHVTHTQLELRTEEECLVACYLIALGEALQSATAVVETPGNPQFELDSQVGIMDTGTGLNTRMWIANIDSTHRTGENASWKVSIGGSLIDTPDMQQIIAEMNTDMPNAPGYSTGTIHLADRGKR